MESNKTTLGAPPKTTVERLKTLLELLNIKMVYYVDDENNLKDLDFELIAGELSKILSVGRIDDLKPMQFPHWDLSLPVDEIAPALRTSWAAIALNEKLEFYQKIIKLSTGEDVRVDLDKSKMIGQQFPDEMIKILSPVEWDEIKDKLAQSLNEGERALVLFDEDLSHAGIKYVSTKGQDLIVELKNQAAMGKVICSLLTGKITDANQELKFRTSIINERAAKDLEEVDFFPLTKERLADPEVFADGIKKTLLNTYFETIKKHTVELIEYSYNKAAKKIQDYDTYDFEDTILRSSIKEGIWEPETILRISDIVFENELKKRMAETDYALKVNKELKDAQKFSEVSFTVPNTMQPYSDKLILRHQEIYDSGAIVNKLRKPLENGDIFEFGDKKYILVSQACDMMIRARGTKQGMRNAKTATLFKIEPQSLKEHIKKKKDKDHYLSDKYALPYFTSGTNDVGVVLFTDFVVVDIDVLDLCVFNENGECRINITTPNIDVNYLSTAWEKRLELLSSKIKEFQSKIRQMNEYLSDKVEPEKLGFILNEFYPKIILSSTENIQSQGTFDGNEFNFLIKRISKFKDIGATRLLEQYTRHLSRVAEPHDFAFSKS